MIELTREHTELIRSVICKTAGSRLPSDVIDELTQDTCSDLLCTEGARSLKSYDPDRGMSLTTFIGMVARSVALDHFRQNTRRNRKTSSYDALEEAGSSVLDLSSHSEDALSMLIRRERREQLVAAVESLTDEERGFLEDSMEGEENFTKKRARKDGMSEVAVRVRKSRVVEKLRCTMKSRG